MSRYLPLLILAGMFLIVIGPFSEAGDAVRPDITGNWQSEQTEDLKNGTYGMRFFVFAPKRWSVTFIRYADRDLELPLYSFYGEGTYELKGPSGQVAGAYDAEFRFSRKFITRLAADEYSIRKYRLRECGPERYVPRDITEKGCSFFRSVADYSVEFDLVKMDDDTLFLGARPADGNMGTEDRRPDSLGEPLKKSAAPAAGVRPGAPAPAPAAEIPPSPDRDQ